MKHISLKPDCIWRYVLKLQSAAFLQHAEEVYRRFERMCSLNLKGGCGINWAERKVNHVGQLQGLHSVKVEGKVQPRTRNKGPKREKTYHYSFFNLGATRDMWSTPLPGPFPLGKDTVPIVYEAGGPQGRSGRVRNISPPQGFDPRTVQTVASRCIDCPIPARLYPVLLHNGHIPFSHSFQKQK
jgi:hypothetical protein